MKVSAVKPDSRPACIRGIKSPAPSVPEKAEVEIHGADDLYKEIRTENELEDEHGKKVKLKEDAPADITVEADKNATTPDTDKKR